MSNAVRKIRKKDLANRPVDRSADLGLADEGMSAVPSPARALQSQLQAHYVPLSERFMTRFVTLFVAFAAIGTWIAQTGVQTAI